MCTSNNLVYLYFRISLRSFNWILLINLLNFNKFFHCFVNGLLIFLRKIFITTNLSLKFIEFLLK